MSHDGQMPAVRVPPWCRWATGALVVVGLFAAALDIGVVWAAVGQEAVLVPLARIALPLLALVSSAWIATYGRIGFAGASNPRTRAALGVFGPSLLVASAVLGLANRTAGSGDDMHLVGHDAIALWLGIAAAVVGTALSRRFPREPRVRASG